MDEGYEGVWKSGYGNRWEALDKVPAALSQTAPSPPSLPFSLGFLSPRALSLLLSPSLYYVGAASGRQPAAADAGGRRARAHEPRG
jgi:hypothetical protein